MLERVTYDTIVLSWVVDPFVTYVRSVLVHVSNEGAEPVVSVVYGVCIVSVSAQSASASCAFVCVEIPREKRWLVCNGMYTIIVRS